LMLPCPAADCNPALGSRLNSTITRWLPATSLYSPAGARPGRRSRERRFPHRSRTSPMHPTCS